MVGRRTGVFALVRPRLSSCTRLAYGLKLPSLGNSISSSSSSSSASSASSFSLSLTISTWLLHPDANPSSMLLSRFAIRGLIGDDGGHAALDLMGLDGMAGAGLELGMGVRALRVIETAWLVCAARSTTRAQGLESNARRLVGRVGEVL